MTTYKTIEDCKQEIKNHAAELIDEIFKDWKGDDEISKFEFSWTYGEEYGLTGASLKITYPDGELTNIVWFIDGEEGNYDIEVANM